MRICVRLAVVASMLGLAVAHARAADAPDFSNPKGAVKAYIIARWSGDIETLKSASVNYDPEFLEASAAQIAAHNALIDAAAKFDDKPQKPMTDSGRAVFAQLVDSAQPKIDGDKATLKLPGEKRVFQLVKNGDQWKVDAAEEFGKGTVAPSFVHGLQVSAEVDKQMVQEVKDGKYNSWKEVDTARREKLKAARAATETKN